MMFDVVVYGRPDCCLCHRADELLGALSSEYSFTVRHINIDEVPELREKWRCHIPVVTIDGSHRVALRLSRERLVRAFEAARKNRDA